MLHHLSFAVADLARSAKFYDAALAPLGYSRVWSDDTAVGYGTIKGQDKFAIRLRPDHQTVAGDGFHVAFSAPSSEAVTAFYEPPCNTAAQTTGLRNSAKSTAPATTPRLSSIPTATASRL